jgi:hypothetical protein
MEFYSLHFWNENANGKATQDSLPLNGIQNIF